LLGGGWIAMLDGGQDAGDVGHGEKYTPSRCECSARTPEVHYD
jgi:hypothetical protein